MKSVTELSVLLGRFTTSCAMFIMAVAALVAGCYATFTSPMAHAVFTWCLAVATVLMVPGAILGTIEIRRRQAELREDRADLEARKAAARETAEAQLAAWAGRPE